MQEIYRSYLKKGILFSDKKTTKTLACLLTFFEIEEIKKLPDFKKLKDLVIHYLSSDESLIFQIAFSAIQKNKISTLKFLIEECKFNLISINCKCKRTEDTLLHKACGYNQTELVINLLKKNCTHKDEWNAVLNSKNNGGATPLHMAIIFKQPQKTLNLLETEINKNMGFQNISCDNLKIGIKNGKIKHQTIPPQLDENLRKEAAYYFMLFGNTQLNQSLLKGMITALIQKIDILNDNDKDLLIDTYILSTGNDIKKHFLSEVEYKKFDPDIVLLKLIAALFYGYISNQQKSEIIETLSNALFDILNNGQEKNQFSQLDRLYNEMAFLYNRIGAFKKAEETASLGLKNSPEENSSKEMRAYLFHNLAKSYDSQFNIESALKNSANAFNLIKNDIAILRLYLELLLMCQDYEKALKICEQSDCGEFSKVSLIGIKTIMKKLDSAEGLKALSCEFSDNEAKVLALNFKKEFYKNLGDYDNVLETQKTCFALEETQCKNNYDQEMGSSISIALKTYLECEKYGEGLIFLNKCKSTYPDQFKKNVILQSWEAMIYLANQNNAKAEKLINTILQFNIPHKDLCGMYTLTAINLISKRNNDEKVYSEAMYYLDFALKIDPDNINAQLYQLLVCILTKNKEKAALIAKKFDLPFLIDLGQRAGLWNIIVIEETNFEIETYDQLKIHQFFQSQKQQILHNLNKNIFSTPKSQTQWSYKNWAFTNKDNDLVALDSAFYPGHYAAIDPNVKLDTEELKIFKNALTKGVCMRSHSENGIKFLNNSVIELKINGDKRLYATAMYKNLDGQYFILFDKMGNHETIKKLVQANKPLEIIELKEPSNENAQFNICKNKLFDTHSTISNNDNGNDNIIKTSFTLDLL